MKYCKNCLLPNTRPQLNIENNTLCTACISSKNKNVGINWKKKKKELKTLLNENKKKQGYDCLVPVSGGKDSTWQVYNLLKMGMKPLAYTYKCQYRTKLGEKNLKNLIELGVDHIDFTVNPKVEKYFMKKAFEKNGSVSIHEHMAMYALGLKLAIKFDIKLVIWGESPALEYGGSKKDQKNLYMNRDWLSKYGVSNGTFIEDWIDDNLTLKDIEPYLVPSDEELEKAKIKPIFLGNYIKWDPLKTAKKSRSIGFKWAKKPIFGYYEYADLDCDFIVIHHMLKWYKFGFTRTWDNLAIEIRNGRLTREEAIRYIKENPDKIPAKQIKKACKFLNISKKKFWNIIESHRNLDIWEKDKNGNWYIPSLKKEFGFSIQNYEK